VRLIEIDEMRERDANATEKRNRRTRGSYGYDKMLVLILVSGRRLEHADKGVLPAREGLHVAPQPEILEALRERRRVSGGQHPKNPVHLQHVHHQLLVAPALHHIARTVDLASPVPHKPLQP